VNEGLRRVVSRAVVRSGLTSLGRSLGNRDGAFILYGHRVAIGDEGYLQGLEPAWLEQQLTYLTRHYEVISLGALVECFEQGRKVPRRTVVLTFDDGFRDNFEIALPILRNFGVPATIFVVTGSLSSGELPWSQRLGFVFQRTEQLEVSHAILGTEPIAVAGHTERRRAYAKAKAAIAGLPRTDRDRIIGELAASLSVSPPLDRMMTWTDAREALAAGYEIGAHTYSHALLGRVSAVEADREMRRSLEDLREHLGVTAPHFCFPAGSLSAQLLAHARTVGFRSSFVPRQRHRVNQLGTVDAFSLSRVGLPNAGADVLEAELDGPFQRLRLAAGRGHRPIEP
jgi:peptidoglycan/xylan/chitin deacetylase (PgdA/CDA1 family)